MAELNQESLVSSILNASNLSYSERISNLNHNIVGNDWNVALDDLISNISNLYK